MSFKYYRFFLEESAQSLEQSAEKYTNIFQQRKNAGFVRAAYDLTGSEKSLSILCQSKTDIVVEEKNWSEYLRANNIPLTPKKEYDELGKRKPHQDPCRKNNTCSHSHVNHHHGHEHLHHENHWVKATLGMVFGFCLLGIPLIGFVLPGLASYLLNGISVLMTLYLGKNLYQSAWQALKKKQITAETLYTISTLTILGLSVFSLIFPAVPLMLESAPLILGFWHLGEAIEHSLVAKINEKSDVRDCAPKTVLLCSNASKPTAVKMLIPNDIIVLRKGDVIPVDGILKQSALLYTTRVNGSPYPKKFRAGDAVKAGMSLADSTSNLEMIVTKTFKNSYLSLMAKNIDTAHKEKAPIELFANKILKYFVPGMIATAFFAGMVLGIIYNPAIAIQSVISILVSACPCALSLITPMAVRIGMKKAAENGVHFKNGKALQSAAHIDAIVFDLNGTLTEGKPSVTNFLLEDKKLLASIAALESHSDHPVSKAILEFIAQQGINMPPALNVLHVDKSHHAGIKGDVNGETFLIGNLEMLHANGITEIEAPYQNIENGTTYVVRGTQVIGQIAITDCLRQDAVKTIQQLKAMNKQIYICTGADSRTAEYYAKQLQIPVNNICANTVGAPTCQNEVSKESYIKKLQNSGLKVAMVGDAANDLTAIARADVGVAVKSRIGDKLTEQHAGITLHQGLLFPIAIAFDVAKSTKQNIYQNLVVSLSYNALITLSGAGLFISLGFVLSPGLGVALMVLESAIVLTNLYRLKIQKTISEPTKKEFEIVSNLKNDFEYTPSVDQESVNELADWPMLSFASGTNRLSQSHSQLDTEITSTEPIDVKNKKRKILAPNA